MATAKPQSSELRAHGINLILLSMLSGGWLMNAIGDDRVERAISAYSYAERQALSNQIDKAE